MVPLPGGLVPGQGGADTCRTRTGNAMSTSFPSSQFMPCPRCGASVAVAEHAAHVCDETRRVEYELFQLREDVARLEPELGDYLDSPHGRFEQWYAERERLRGDPVAQDAGEEG